MASLPWPSQSVHSNTFQSQNVHINTVVHPSQTVTTSSRRDPMDVFQEHVAFGALYNSRERFDPPKCHPQTRTAILDRIEQWANDDSVDAKPILWLSGPAGAGKSAIAQTLVEKWKEKGVTTFAFFFWRTSSERNQNTRLVPTIAFQLLELFPSIGAEIKETIDTGGLFERNLTFQLEKLVVGPLHGLRKSLGQQPIVIVIDGLDECCINLPGQDYESQQREVLEAFASAFQKAFPLRLLLVSRPERQIRNSFSAGILEKLTSPLSMKNATGASADIRLFLECRFHEIRKQHGIDFSWPTEAQLLELVRKSSGQFIYPSIAIKHITRARANPIQSLKVVLDLQPGSVDNPLAELDMLYTLVLKSVSVDSLPVVTDILGYLLPYYSYDNLQVANVFRLQAFHNSPTMFEKVLFLPEGEVKSHFTDLHSIIDIPPTTYGPIGFIHATFSEYLQDRSRSGEFFISKEMISFRYTFVLLRHLHHWVTCGESHMYYTDRLISCTCSWVDHCSPSRSLMTHLWGLMKVELGQYPLAFLDPDSQPPANEQLSIQFVAEAKKLGATWIRDLLVYLQKCNIPEIEPSWLRRYLVPQRLSAALSGYSK